LGENYCEGSTGWSASWRSKVAAAELVIRYLVHTRATQLYLLGVSCIST